MDNIMVVIQEEGDTVEDLGVEDHRGGGSEVEVHLEDSMEGVEEEATEAEEGVTEVVVGDTIHITKSFNNQNVIHFLKQLKDVQVLLTNNKSEKRFLG